MREQAVSEYLTIPELAELLKCSASALYDMAHAGDLPGVVWIGTSDRKHGRVHYPSFLAQAGLRCVARPDAAQPAA